MSNENNLKTLTRQTKTVRMVINFPCAKGLYNLACYNLSKFADDLSACCFLYAFILHDKDTDENGELKTPHIHLFIISDKRHQLKYYIYLIADLLQVNESLISCRVSNSDAGDIQYLVHKNDLNKYQYNVSDVKTNISKDMFDSLMERKVVDDITAKELIKLCSEHSVIELIEILGPIRYQLYSKAIKDIYKEIRLMRVREHVYTKYPTVYKDI